MSRPLDPKDAGSSATMDTAKGIVFCDDIISAATASRGGNRSSLKQILQKLFKKPSWGSPPMP